MNKVVKSYNEFVNESRTPVRNRRTNRRLNEGKKRISNDLYYEVDSVSLTL
jgi:hypothetical protein